MPEKYNLINEEENIVYFTVNDFLNNSSNVVLMHRKNEEVFL